MRVNGKPQQRFVCHLTSIKENKLAHTDTPFYFWDDVSKKLNVLNLDATERLKIETMLAAKIQRPDDAEIARWLAERAARFQRLTETLTAKLGIVRSA
jgi:wyosine [tRNA(Phe)-imidazoG37] synthetase (radical SAM superfamily)